MKRLSSRARLCPICSEPCKKKGVTSAGTQRWYCLTCHFSFTATDTRQARAAQFQQFLDYVTDTQPLRRLAPTGIKAWQRDHAWCWATRPIWQVTGEVYDQVFIDGTYIGYGLCLLTATTPNKIIAYQLCNQETKAAYTALLSRIPAPAVVTTDGDRGALAAIKACWPTSRLQRCLVHVQRNIRTLTTTRPKTDQHKALYKLALDLTKITTADQAIAWQKGLAAFHTLYDTWLAERTYKATVAPLTDPALCPKQQVLVAHPPRHHTPSQSLRRLRQGRGALYLPRPHHRRDKPPGLNHELLRRRDERRAEDLPTSPPRPIRRAHEDRPGLLPLHPLHRPPTPGHVHQQHPRHHQTQTRT